MRSGIGTRRGLKSSWASTMPSSVRRSAYSWAFSFSRKGKVPRSVKMMLPFLSSLAYSFASFISSLAKKSTWGCSFRFSITRAWAVL